MWRADKKITPLEARVVPPFKVTLFIGTDTDRSSAYDFLLIRIVTMGLPRTVSDINGDFSWKLPIFPTPVYLTLPLMEFLFECRNGGSAKNPGGRKFVVCVFISIQ